MCFCLIDNATTGKEEEEETRYVNVEATRVVVGHDTRSGRSDRNEINKRTFLATDRMTTVVASDDGDVMKFATLHLELLDVEREAELSQALEEAKSITSREARLMCDSLTTGRGGRIVVTLRRRSGLPLVLGRISVGDVVCIRPVSEGGGGGGGASMVAASASAMAKYPRGVVSRLTDLAVSVTLDSTDGVGGDDDDANNPNNVDINSSQMSSVYLIRLANDVTYDRLRESLRNLPRLAERRVVKVAFGHAEPRFLGELDAATAPAASVAANGDVAATSKKEFVVFDRGLNESQVAAVQFALHSSDIALIHGPPGTGMYMLFVAFWLARRFVKLRA